METINYGEGGTGITGQNFNKPCIMKGNQTVLVSDFHCIRSYAYSHRHKFHVNHPGCNLWRNIEVKEIMELTKLVVEGDEGDQRKTLLEHPHSTWENYFSKVHIINWIGGNGCGSTMKCGRDRLPGEIQGQYLHKKTDSYDKTNVA